MKNIFIFHFEEMKDIADFSSDSVSNGDAQTSDTKSIDEKLENKEDSSSAKAVSNILNEPGTKKKSGKRKGKRIRKPSDPVVRGITELLSSNLSLISPNNSTLNHIEPGEDKYEISGPSCETDSTKENEPCIDLEKEDQTPSKPNAFQFMMNSRNKIIGTNSPGKELHDNKEPDDTISKRVKLAARKNLLSNWAEQKGAFKRKIVDDELDEVINHKLSKRAKRLKKLLKVDEKHDESTEVIVKNTRKKTARLVSYSSSIESDSDFEMIKVKNSNCKSNSKKPLSDEIQKGAKIKDHLKGTEGITRRNTKTKQTKIYTETQDSEKPSSEMLNLHISPDTSSTSKTKESRQSILSFFDKLNGSRTNEVNGENPKLEDGVKSTRKQMKTDSTIECDETETDVVIIKDISQVKKRASKKKKSRSKPIFIDESSCESSSITPRKSSWKMKIKINDDEIKILEKDEKCELRIRKEDIGESAVDDEEENEEDIKIISSESEEELSCKNKSIKHVKIAPVFMKATPKPLEDPAVKEARKQFLMSGIPSSLKRAIEKQQSTENKETCDFPTISHVPQRCENKLWNLPDPKLNVKDSTPLKIDPSNLICNEITKSHIPQKINIKIEMEKIDKLKFLLNKIKADNPNYPVYKSFRGIYDKSGKRQISKNDQKKVSPKGKKANKGERKKSAPSCGIVDPTEMESVEHSMWTEKYKPKCSADIIGNSESVRKLRQWLEIWMKYSNEINTMKRKRAESSGSEFEMIDSDSRDSLILPSNTVVLGGPCGSGKSTAVYAICNELGFNVIELNASSKRTGKRLLQEIQEATQSHQVRKKDSQFFFEKNKNAKEKIETIESQCNSKKMCVILIEDIDIVFEQDDGFISALTQLAITSKRPIILTTTDYDSVFVKKFLNQYEYIPFLPLSSFCLATWLQIVCLVEGVFVEKADVGNFLDFNKGDVRKTLLQLQYWVMSGGQIFHKDLPIKIEEKRTSCEEKIVDDEQPSCSLVETTQEGEHTSVHRCCIGSFEIFSLHESFIVPYYLDLGMLWWNIPNIIGNNDCHKQRVAKFRQEPQKEDTKAVAEKSEITILDNMRLKTVAKLYDALLFTDVMFRKVNYFDSFEPVVSNVKSRITNSLELAEDLRAFSDDTDFVHEVTHSLVDGRIKAYNVIANGQCKLDMAVPDRTEQRWRAKQRVCDDVFQDALCMSSCLERKSFALDYMPVLRNISRSECVRAANNTKRGNRFRNYLKDLGVNCRGDTVKLACNILKETG